MTRAPDTPANSWPLGTSIHLVGDTTQPLESLVAQLLRRIPDGLITSVCWDFSRGLTTLSDRVLATLVERRPAEPGGRDRLTWHVTTGDVAGRLEIRGGVRRPGEPSPGLLPEMIDEGLDPLVRPGIRVDLDEVVDETNTTRHLGGPALLATPSMVLTMERASAAAIEPYIHDGYGTVGAHNDIAHLRPARLGETVSYSAVLVGVNGRRLIYEVEALVKDRLIGAGRHEGHVVWTQFGSAG